MHWHSLTTEDVFDKTGSSHHGLTEEEAQQRLEKNGANELTAKKKKSALAIFFRQFLDVMILVLAAAAVISASVGEIPDALVIVVIIILNAVVGFVQEYRAEKAMDALNKMSAPSSMVRRDQRNMEIPASQIVQGDIVLLDAGDMVPADLRLIEVHALKSDESSLTGESQAIDKTVRPIPEKEITPGDKTNMAFKGTVITHGRGKGIVIATGMHTELGKIAGMLQEKESATPLQKRMADFSKKLTVIIIVICAIIFGTGWLRGEDVTRMLLTAISVAVAAIPEALPAVITISLAVGARKLVKQNVLIRKLYAVETLGSVTYICSDKTGTLTKNQMTVKDIWIGDDNKTKELIKAMSLNHDVKEKKDQDLMGDPTEVAMVNYARGHENYDESWEEENPREDELPFDPERKAMSTIHRAADKYKVITKGALDAVVNMSATRDNKWKEQEARMAREGMRVIAFAGREVTELPEEMTPEEIEKDLELIGLIGLIDPPREEAKEAIKECKSAGIIPVMITGDHPLTAAAIAKELGILENKDQKVMTGAELSKIAEKDFESMVEQIRVYARVSPRQKLNIVKALQNKGHFVSMTGDGVNDAPSLRKANIGVAMGITGTDVTKEAAHMILLDDNFATIVKAVKEGRRIYDNIRKFIKYIMTGNSAEIWTIFLAPFFGLPIPLLPVHILWINLVTDGLPALALAAEPAEKNIMRRRPRKTNESIFAGGLGIHCLWVGVLMGLLTIGAQWYEINSGDRHWQTIVFTVLCFGQLWHVMAIRSDFNSLFTQGLFSNKSLLGAVAVTVLLQFMVIYIPQLSTFFHTSPLSWVEMLTAIAVSSIIFWAVEIEKLVKRTRSKRTYH